LKVAIINDTHYGVKNDSVSFAAYQNKFFNEVFLPHLIDNNITHVLHLGDLFDRRKYVNFITAKNVEENFVKPLMDAGITMHMVAGNHDTYFKNTNDVNSLKQLYGNTKYDRFMSYWNDTVEIELDGCKIMLCPWVCDENRDRIKESIRDTNAQVLMGHFEIAGFEMYRGAVCEHGDAIDSFSKFDMVFSGHFHHKSTHRNISYLGAPYEMTWSDYNDPKGFHIFDTGNRSLEFILNPFRMFHKIEYDDNDMTIEDVAQLDTFLLTNTHIKVIVKSKENPYIFDLFMDKLLQSGAADIKVIDDLTSFDVVDESDMIDEAQDTLTILSKYLESIEVKSEKKIVEKFLHDLYNEAINL
jgi:DNA repair exonuclease SbcCD nuclease subunit